MPNEPSNKRRFAPPANRGGAGAGRGSAPSTMNRPDSDRLNTNAEATVAAQFFAREQSKEKEFKPAIATGFVPPVVKGPGAPEPEKQASPFKAAPKAPIKRPKNGTSPFAQEEEEEKPEQKGPVGPQIAQFIPIPVLEKPASPFAPIDQQKTENGLKAPIKRPKSASVNHAMAGNDDPADAEYDDVAEEAQEEAASPFKRSPLAGPSSSSARKSPFAPPQPANQVKSTFSSKSRETKTSDKTFVPLAPVPYFEKQEEEVKSPFAPRVEKTEEQIRKEEEAARRAYEASVVEKKKSTLDKIMDNLNRPIF